jgi:ubiquitin-activating enzyme E1
VTVYDPTIVEASDLGANYYLEPKHVGASRRDEACVGQLKELNSYVRVSTLSVADASAGLTEADLAKFSVVVFCDDGAAGSSRSRAELEKFNSFCRTQTPAIGFIVCHIRGIAGKVFVDFGDDHKVFDENGEQNRNATVMSIDKGEQTLVTTEDSKRHGFDEGDFVVFRDVEGMVELNDSEPVKIVDTTAYSFKVELDSRKFGDFQMCSASVEQTKMPKSHSFASYADRRSNPLPADDPMGMLITPDLGKFGRPAQLHVAFEAVDAFVLANGRLPKADDDADAAAVVEAAKQLCTDARKDGAETQLPEVGDVEEDVVAAVARRAVYELQPLAAFFGGILAQEVVKFTGKFSPLRQFLYLDAIEVLPEDDHALASTSAADFALDGGRYDHMLGIFGRRFVDHVQSRKVFLVGSGALGCEFLKNFAMIGLACGATGRITVTDMDNIEVSNLNRQFLFRPEDVGKAKSVCAAAAAAVMNPDLKVEALEIPVGPDTEDKFDDAFWSGLDVVTNALDNVQARQYVDGICVFHHKPLLESGTLGTKANVQVVAPNLTESYGDSQDPEEESIPMCTLKNFPHQIEHCIEWARDLFQGTFTASIQEAAAFRDEPAEWVEKTLAEPNAFSRRHKIEGVHTAVGLAEGADWNMCVHEALKLFHKHFFTNISQLLHNFPKDYVNKETGVPFWSGHKRAPTAIEFSVDDQEHLNFVSHTAALIAFNFGVELPADWSDVEALRATTSAMPMPAFEPKKVAIKSGDDDDTVEGGEDDDVVAAEIADKLRGIAADKADVLAGLKLFPADFEKDDDSNHHIDCITATSNMRASNYRIPTVPRHRVKIIAGKIIPAVATTTCAVTGLVGIELLKTLRNPKIEAFRNSYLSLAVNVYSMSEPMTPKKTVTKKYDPITMGPVRAQPEGFTPWDQVVISGSPATTVGELRDELASTQKVDIDIISVNIGGEIKMLFAPMFAPSHKAREPKTVLDVVAEMGLALPAARKYIVMDVGCSDADGDVAIPRVVFRFA